MRALWIVGALLLAGPALGETGRGETGHGKTGQGEMVQNESTCDLTARLVAETVAARADGQSRAKARAPLRERLGREAGDMLVEWVWSLPKDQLTPAVGAAWKTQCEAQ
ncbi:hypothetical protein KO516_17290 [Citreicella sp. C3M06]|uniref:hypothetical protein n=1 Tax=Citreicella sp. C3M06 TaxID=2841564 RepID=UPI001C08E385|nr:hypothetical protein [Citreicella sp. C3M06]MBU2962545.1 hypothetical protein [Citreicella sp. C3M06]